MLNSEAVSRIVNDIGAITKDQHVSKRWILSVLQSHAKSFIAQHWAEGTLTRDNSLMSYINCIEMIPINKVDCCFVTVPLCQTLYRSKHRIPGLLNTRFGPSVLRVSNITNTLYFSPSSIMDYNSREQLMFADKAGNHVYWEDDGYIYIPEKILGINVVALSVNRHLASKLSACSDKNEDNCKSAWDFEFVCPDRLENYVFSNALKEVSMRLQIPMDTNPNMDLNQKSQTRQ